MPTELLHKDNPIFWIGKNSSTFFFNKLSISSFPPPYYCSKLGIKEPFRPDKRHFL